MRGLSTPTSARGGSLRDVEHIVISGSHMHHLS
jgi:hypothetical protein